MKIIDKNKRAGYDYFIIEKIEAGIVLTGTEVKSLRAGKASIKEAFISIDRNSEAWLQNMSIPQYEFGNLNNHEEIRKRKLLLSKKQIIEMNKRAHAEGLAIIPTIIYFKNSLVKVEVALAKGKKLHDKRQTEAKKDIEKKIRQGNYD